MKHTTSKDTATLAASLNSLFDKYSTVPTTSGCLVFSPECTNDELIAAFKSMIQTASAASTWIAWAEADACIICSDRGINRTELCRQLYGVENGERAAKRWGRRARIARQVPPDSRCLDLPFEYYVKYIEGQSPRIVIDNNNYTEIGHFGFDTSSDPIICHDISGKARPRRIPRDMWSGLVQLAEQKGLRPMAPHGATVSTKSDENSNVDAFADAINS